MESESDTTHRLTLRRGDQFVAAAITACALFALAFHWVARGGLQGKIIEVDRVRPGTIEFTVDINEAQWPELTVIPAVGETLAKRITDYRAEHGPFREWNELENVRGIGPRTLERMRPYLRPLTETGATADRGGVSKMEAIP